MSIQQGQTMLLNSTASLLPTGATSTRFPLTAGSARGIQELISTRFVMLTRQFSGA
jgi:hypothetical protein